MTFMIIFFGCSSILRRLGGSFAKKAATAVQVACGEKHSALITTAGKVCLFVFMFVVCVCVCVCVFVCGCVCVCVLKKGNIPSFCLG